MKDEALPLEQRGERRLDTLPLRFGDQAGQHLREMRVPGARVDVLPAIGLEKGGFDRLVLVRLDAAAASAREIARIGRGLLLQDRVDGGDQFDEIIDAAIALRRAERSVMPQQLEF